MSNHIHLIVRANEETSGISDIIRDFKKFTSKSLLNFLLTSNKESRSRWMQLIFRYHAKFNKRNSKYQFWKQDNRPKILLSPKFTARKLNYIHNNPVVAKIVDREEYYMHSSAIDYAGMGNGLLNIEILILVQ